MQLLPFLYPAVMGILMIGDEVNAAKKIAKDAILLSNVRSPAALSPHSPPSLPPNPN